MPTPILTIPINDEAFKGFLATFQKYQEQLAAQPEMWRDINASLETLAAAGGEVSAGIDEQTSATEKLSAEEQKRSDILKKIALDRASEDHAQEARDRASSKRRMHAIEQVKNYASRIADAGRNLLKWASIDTVIGAATGVFGLWGLDRIAGNVGNQYRSAQGIGTSMSKYQGMNVAMQRYFDVGGVMENVANMQQDPATWGTFRMMGVNPTGKDPASLTTEMALAARRMFLADKGNLMLAQAQGLTNVFSADDLRRLAATPEKELRDSSKAATGFQGMHDDVGKKWQNLSVTMGTALMKAESLFLTDLMKINRNGSIDKLIMAFEQMAESILNHIDWDELGRGMKKFADYVTDGSFQHDFGTFIEDVSAVAKKLQAALVWLNIIPDPDAESTTPPAWTGFTHGRGDADEPDSWKNGWGLFKLHQSSRYPRSMSELQAGEGGPAPSAGGSGHRRPIAHADTGFLTKAENFMGSAAGAALAATAAQFAVPAYLLAGIFGAESAFGKNPGTSSAGARGPFQFMPATARRFGVTNRDSYAQSSVAAAKYMNQLLTLFHGDEAKAVAAYNWGEGNVLNDIYGRKDRRGRRHGGHGDDWLRFAPKGTQDYVSKVLATRTITIQQKPAARTRPTAVNVRIHNQTGASVATTANAMASG